LNDELSLCLQERVSKLVSFFELGQNVQTLRLAQINQSLVGRFNNDRKSQIAKLFQIGDAADDDAARDRKSMPFCKFVKSRLVVESFHHVRRRKPEPVGAFQFL